MLVLFSQIQKYLPDLEADVNEVAQVFTFTGQMIDKLIEVEYNGKKDFVLDLEVRQNRADCFGVHGLARELSAYYNIPLEFPSYELPESSSRYNLPIEIEAVGAVKRVVAVKFGNITISESPAWLKEYLALYEINSINNLVDLTNYVMIETGFPSHVFDTDKIGDKLVWEINPEYKKMTTLNGVEIDLAKADDLLVISDGKRPLSLSFIGGKTDAVDNSSKNIILEMGIYDGGLVRRNSRKLSIITEASQRLEKYLDPEMIPMAFSMLVKLIQENCGGTIESEIYDRYVQPTEKKEIRIRVEKISQIAGIEIPLETSLSTLQKLGFEILSQNNEEIVVLRPINRLDVSIEEDVIEEIIRIYGYTNIPADNLTIEITKDITPSHLILIDHVQNILEANGYDEVRSWVLVDSEKNQKANFESWEVIEVTNSINEEVPYLRQSLSVSLLEQLNTYRKNNVKDIQIFEIGKVFGKKEDKYLEHYSLGLLRGDSNINELKLMLEKVIRFFEINEVVYEEAKSIPMTAHPKTIWNVKVIDAEGNLVNIGIIYVSNKVNAEECAVAEINIDEFNNVVLGQSIRSVHEVDQKLVELDANITVTADQDPSLEIINKLKDIENIWSWNILDNYNGKVTVRVTYMNMGDQEAKKLHGEIFK